MVTTPWKAPAKMLILASESPRRRTLLKEVVADFRVVAPCVEELEGGADLEALPEKNALLKAGAVADLEKDVFVLGADTAVFAAGEMLGKPANEEEAFRMLSMLSGREHKVISGVALLCRNRNVCCSWSVVSKVYFKELSPEEIRRYMERVNVLDKAGAYAIQEHPELLGARWEGELENIIGLPLAELARVLRANGL